MNKKDIEAVLKSILSVNGFSKKGTTWYRQSKEVLQGVDLQKSNYGDQFFINLCFAPNGMELDGMPTPKENKFPIRIRLTSVFSEKSKEIEVLFNLEREDVSDTKRAIDIVDLFEKNVISFLNEISTSENLIDAIKKGIFNSGAVNLAVRQYLSLEGC